MEENTFYSTLLAESVILSSSKRFQFFNKKFAEEITKNGKKEMRKLMSKFKLKNKSYWQVSNPVATTNEFIRKLKEKLNYLDINTL